MQLRLIYSEHHQAPVNATIITGSDAHDWLTEISSWDVDLRAFRCFVLPETISINRAGGLFVIFQHEALTSKLSLKTVYTQIAPDFYIPAKAILFPNVTADELSKLKLWEIQVFHPATGLVGFEAKDELKLTGLIKAPELSEKRWLPADPPVPPYPRLYSISLEPEDIPFDINAVIEQKPLNEIPDSEQKQHTLQKRALRLFSMAGLWLLLILAAIGKIIFAIIGAFFGKKPGRPLATGKAGLFKRLENWINQRLKDIEKQRDSELNRLVKLFDKDNDEALHYAIPLNSPYLNRGTAPKSGKLTRRSLQTNWRNFGGGGRVDHWDLGDYRLTLRQQYIKALNAAIQKGDYKKAAYIYAHLLGDLTMAAQTLQNGKHYREAAAIYKDHLKNNAKAADCLEKGGLLAEAIPVYVELGSYEKAGDLHKQLGQDLQATKYYNDTVKRSLDAKDYLNAARIKAEKMDESNEARSILLTGWEDDNHPELCLKKYFELEPEQELSAEVRVIYEQHVSLKKKTSFLNVLADLSAEKKEEHLQQTILDLSYVIVHQQMNRGDHSGLKLLNKFLPEDRLLAQDTSRYLLQNHQQKPMLEASSYLQLRQDTKWTEIINYHDQLIAVGIRNDEMHLLRGNWEGRIAYEFLFRLNGLSALYRLIADAQVSDHILLNGHAVPERRYKRHEAYSYFEKAFDFDQLHWELPGTLGYAQKPHEDQLFILHVDGDYLCMDLFSLDGSLLQKTYCLGHDERLSIYDLPFLRYSEIYWRKDHFYFVAQDRLIRVDDKGNMEMLELECNVYAFSISGPFAALKVAVLTERGCMIITPGIKSMKISAPPIAPDIDARLVLLLADNRLVVASETLAFVYDVSSHTPKLIWEIQPENAIVRLLTVPKRHHFAILEADNRISIHRLDEQASA